MNAPGATGRVEDDGQQRAERSLSSLPQSASPTMGSTDFWKVLRYLSLLPPAQGLRNVLLISDGHLQGDSLTLQLVERHMRHTRLLSCGVG